MKKDYCDITLILDESGSMEHLRHDTIGGVNRFLDDNRKAKLGTCTVSLVKFNGDRSVIYTARPIDRAENLSVNTYTPSGSTALLDAVGVTVTETGKRLAALLESERPEKVIVVIVTDGEENASHEYKRDQVRAMIETQQSVYQWEFVFIGANVDAFSEAGKLGIFVQNSLQAHATGQSVNHVYQSLSANTVRYRAGASPTMAWTGEQRAEQESTAKS